MKKPRTWVDIDLGNVASNIRYIRDFVASDVRIMAVVKADAYGHGAVSISRTALACGASALGVGDSTEAIELREAGITAAIFILGAICEREIEEMVNWRIIPTIHSLQRVRLLQKVASRQKKRLQVNVMVDTGMGRVGVRPETVFELIEEIVAAPNLELIGLSTHFSSAHLSDIEFSLEQLMKFRWVIANLWRRGHDVPLIHAANSAALFALPESHFTMVRPGAAIYGIDPGNFKEEKVSVTPALAWRSQIVFLKDVAEETPIGYSRTYQTKQATKIATIPVGYDDGYPFDYSNRATVLVKGVRCPVVGNVTMDYIMIDVGAVSDVRLGETVTLLGKDAREQITVTELAHISSAPPYSITTLLGRRVKKIYIDTVHPQQQELIPEKQRRKVHATASVR